MVDYFPSSLLQTITSWHQVLCMGSCTLFFMFLMSKYPSWLAHKRKLTELTDEKKKQPEWVSGGTCLYKRIENWTERNLVIVWLQGRGYGGPYGVFKCSARSGVQAHTLTRWLRHGVCYCKLQKGCHIHCHFTEWDFAIRVNNSSSNVKEILGRCSRKSHKNRNMLFFLALLISGWHFLLNSRPFH